MLQPLARMIRKADTEGSTHNSLVYYEMLLFQQHVAEHQGLPKPEHKQAQSLVLERWKFLHHPVHSASYVLNPALMTREEDPLMDSEIRNDVAQVFESFDGKEHEQPNCNCNSSLRDVESSQMNAFGPKKVLPLADSIGSKLSAMKIQC